MWANRTARFAEAEYGYSVCCVCCAAVVSGLITVESVISTVGIGTEMEEEERAWIVIYVICLEVTRSFSERSLIYL
jgi:hypothetical protein